MDIFRVQDNVPEVYVNESRDFQVFCRLYDSVINGTRFDISTITNVIDTSSCSSNLLQLLKTKLGFYTDIDISDDDLRDVLISFPYLIKNKGSKKAIEDCLNLFFRLKKISNAEYSYDIVNKRLTTEEEENIYKIIIYIKGSLLDTSILNELFRYILPTGYIVEFVFYDNVLTKDTPTEFSFNISNNSVSKENSINSQLRADSDSYADIFENKIFNTVGTMELYSDLLEELSNGNN